MLTGGLAAHIILLKEIKRRYAMVYVSAGELKKRGVSLLDDLVGEEGEAIITVRGKSK